MMIGPKSALFLIKRNHLFRRSIELSAKLSTLGIEKLTNNALFQCNLNLHVWLSIHWPRRNAHDFKCSLFCHQYKRLIHFNKSLMCMQYFEAVKQ